LEEGRQATHHFKELYWNCLAEEALTMLSTKVTVEDFRSYLLGACSAEKQAFRVPFVDYLAMKHPEMTMQDHSASFDYVIQAAIDETVSGFVKARTAQ